MTTQQKLEELRRQVAQLRPVIGDVSTTDSAVWDCGYNQPPTSLAHYTAQPGLGGYQKATTAG